MVATGSAAQSQQRARWMVLFAGADVGFVCHANFTSSQPANSSPGVMFVGVLRVIPLGGSRLCNQPASCDFLSPLRLASNLGGDAEFNYSVQLCSFDFQRCDGDGDGQNSRRGSFSQLLTKTTQTLCSCASNARQSFARRPCCLSSGRSLPQPQLHCRAANYGCYT